MPDAHNLEHNQYAARQLSFEPIRSSVGGRCGTAAAQIQHPLYEHYFYSYLATPAQQLAGCPSPAQGQPSTGASTHVYHSHLGNFTAAEHL